MLNLDKVTLYAVDCKYYEKTILAINESLKQASFNEVIFLSDKEPINLDDRIKFIKIRNIESLDDYSKFIIEELPNYINTEFCMSIHYDGWILNADNWKDEFLDYDYIGGPWAKDSHFLPPGEKFRVGNGGVSIRSKKLMDTIKKIAPDVGYHEDTLIAHTYRNHLEEAGLTFAPLDLAKYFSYEVECTDLDVTFDEVFAFHGISHTDDHKSKMKYITELYYRDVLPKLDNERVLNWLYYKAGSQDPINFPGAYRGNLNLQQIPFEYVNLLDFFRKNKIESYLELGVGNGGSFLVDSLFIGKKCKKFHAVDNLAYAGTHIKQTEEKIMSKVNTVAKLFPDSETKFFNKTTDAFFENNTEKYDCIFIDADHEYDGVKKDYINALKFLNDGGFIIFHDIGNTTTGVAECWNEIKDNAKNVEEFLWKAPNTDLYRCGIGIYYT